MLWGMLCFTIAKKDSRRIEWILFSSLNAWGERQTLMRMHLAGVSVVTAARVDPEALATKDRVVMPTQR